MANSLMAYIIDPRTRSIVIRGVNDTVHGMADELKRLNGVYTGIDSMSLATGDRVWVDDMGYKIPDLPVFEIEGYPHPLAGGAIVFGLDRETGENTAPVTPQEQLKRWVRWTDQVTTGDCYPTRQDGVRTILGGPITRTGGRS